MTDRVLAHIAELQLSPGADQRAPGGAVTVALCGTWEHEGACRWPHLTECEARGADRIRVRVVALAPADDVDDVRRSLVAALHTGTLDGPHGRSDWQVLSDAPDDVTDADDVWGRRQTPR
jgi:hypothetical protein